MPAAEPAESDRWIERPPELHWARKVLWVLIRVAVAGAVLFGLYLVVILVIMRLFPRAS